MSLSAPFPTGLDCRADIIAQLRPFWVRDPDRVASLPVARAAGAGAGIPGTLPVEMRAVSLPAWAEDIGVEGALLVPVHAAGGGKGVHEWERIDWFAVAFWFLHGLAEREFERCHGPIHSYSSRLRGWDGRMWDHAWVNRIALFLRRWAARLAGVDEEGLFGPLPVPQWMLTHDVDAIRKSLILRCKQSAFYGFNALRLLARGQAGRAGSYAGRAFRFLLRTESYDFFDRIEALERAHGIRSVYFFFARPPGRRDVSLATRIIDPAYDVTGDEATAILSRLREQGAPIGLHPSHASWADATALREERETLERVAGGPAGKVRQHWLMFSWEETWRAQAEAGLREDFTLGFNDRPGFRNGCALPFRPLDADGQPLGITATPTILMDSHLYNYREATGPERRSAMNDLAEELALTGGRAACIWHSQVFGQDYGWGGGYEDLLDIISSASFGRTASMPVSP